MTLLAHNCPGDEALVGPIQVTTATEGRCGRQLGRLSAIAEDTIK